MSLFEASIAICGLSRSEAARFFDVSPETVKSWCQGRRNVPFGVWSMLASLYPQIVEVSKDALDTLDFDELQPDSLDAIAIERYGDKLPEPALKAALAMAYMARLSDDDV